MKNYLENVDREALRARAEQMLHYADEARDTASRWTNHAVEKAHGFSLFDFAIFETCLLSLGLWLQVLQEDPHGAVCRVRGELAVYALARLFR